MSTTLLYQFVHEERLEHKKPKYESHYGLVLTVYAPKTGPESEAKYLIQTWSG